MVSPYLVTNPDKLETSLTDAAVFITDMPLNFTNEFLKMIQDCVSKGHKNILIICDEFHPDVLTFAVRNMAKGICNIAIVQKPMQKEYLEDIAAVVGAMAMTSSKGLDIPKVEYMGHCSKFTANEKTTTIFAETSEKLENYITSLKKQTEEITDTVIQTKLQERIARLTGGVFVVSVGANTEAAQKYLRDKVDDAVNSLKKVWKEKKDGVVAGGGSVLYHIGNKLLKSDSLTNGEKIVFSVCRETLLQMLENCGEEESVLNVIDEKGGGYNSFTLEYEPDMYKAGIIDAKRIIKKSFENVVDFASEFATYGGVISKIPEKDTKGRLG